MTRGGHLDRQGDAHVWAANALKRRQAVVGAVLEAGEPAQEEEHRRARCERTQRLLHLGRRDTLARRTGGRAAPTDAGTTRGRLEREDDHRPRRVRIQADEVRLVPLRRQLADTLAPELEARGTDSGVLLDALDQCTGWEAWRALRDVRHLTGAAAERAMAFTAGSLLG